MIIILFVCLFVCFLQMAIGAHNPTIRFPAVSQSMVPSVMTVMRWLANILYTKDLDILGEAENVQQIWRGWEMTARMLEPVRETTENLFAGKYVLTWLNFDISK